MCVALLCLYEYKILSQICSICFLLFLAGLLTSGCVVHSGDMGEAGTPGSDGPPGPNGETGQKGEPGADGSDGANGEKGEKGEAGDQGRRGSRGDVGTPGAEGAKVHMHIHCVHTRKEYTVVCKHVYKNT